MRSPDDGYLGLMLLPIVIAFAVATVAGGVFLALKLRLLPRICAIICWISGIASLLLLPGEAQLVIGIASIVFGAGIWTIARKNEAKR